MRRRKRRIGHGRSSSSARASVSSMQRIHATRSLIDRKRFDLAGEISRVQKPTISTATVRVVARQRRTKSGATRQSPTRTTSASRQDLGRVQAGANPRPEVRRRSHSADSRVEQDAGDRPRALGSSALEQQRAAVERHAHDCPAHHSLSRVHAATSARTGPAPALNDHAVRVASVSRRLATRVPSTGRSRSSHCPSRTSSRSGLATRPGGRGAERPALGAPDAGLDRGREQIEDVTRSALEAERLGVIVPRA